MNIKEQIEQIKIKYESVSANWNKLTVEQIYKIDEFLNEFAQQVPTTRTTTTTISYHRNWMNDARYNEITELRSKGYSWREVAKRFGFANSYSISNLYYVYPSKRAAKLSQQVNISVPPADDT